MTVSSRVKISAEKHISTAVLLAHWYCCAIFHLAFIEVEESLQLANARLKATTCYKLVRVVGATINVRSSYSQWWPTVTWIRTSSPSVHLHVTPLLLTPLPSRKRVAEFLTRGLSENGTHWLTDPSTSQIYPLCLVVHASH